MQVVCLFLRDRFFGGGGGEGLSYKSNNYRICKPLQNMKTKFVGREIGSVLQCFVVDHSVEVFLLLLSMSLVFDVGFDVL